MTFILRVVIAGCEKRSPRRCRLALFLHYFVIGLPSLRVFLWGVWVGERCRLRRLGVAISRLLSGLTGLLRRVNELPRASSKEIS